MKVILEKDDGFIEKAAKKAYGGLKQSLVATLTGNAPLTMVGKILDALSFLHIVDRKKADEQLKKFTAFQDGGLDKVDAFLDKVPLLEDLFGSEKDFLVNLGRFSLFSQ